MKNFSFEFSTKIHFGRGAVKYLPEEVKRYGDHIFFLYDEIPARATGAYDEIHRLCEENNIKVTDFTGIEPNPRHSTVDRAAAALKECGANVIVALGGGSTMDSAKALSFTVYHDGSCWDIYEGRAKIEKTMPIITIPTMAASGAEVSNISVISNIEENKKYDVRDERTRARVTIADPAYTFSVPRFQTALGIIDIFSHASEGYFHYTVGSVQDGIAEALMRTCIDVGPKVLLCPEDYESRAQMLWAAEFAITHIQDMGRTFVAPVHNIDAVLSAFYDVPHAAGIAVISIAWFKYILNDDTVPRMARWGRNVWGIHGDDEYAVAREAIVRYEEFIRSLGLPTRISELKQKVPEDALARMAAARYSEIPADQYFVPLQDQKELETVFRLAY